mmetsp:Transcript_2169/g.4737  ORF Transcript_2169/g.4737 Transcript_2169/m.4737 type:complete len:104 (+) Transcript_2169:226-537(+)
MTKPSLQPRRNSPKEQKKSPDLSTAAPPATTAPVAATAINIRLPMLPSSFSLTVTNDYELHASALFNRHILSSFENRVARDLASQFGLVDCAEGGSGQPKRRI